MPVSILPRVFTPLYYSELRRAGPRPRVTTLILPLSPQREPPAHAARLDLGSKTPGAVVPEAEVSRFSPAPPRRLVSAASKQ